MLCGGRVRDCSGKPTACAGPLCTGKGEDLQRKARAVGNAHIIKQIEKTYLIINHLRSCHYKI